MCGLWNERVRWSEALKWVPCSLSVWKCDSLASSSGDQPLDGSVDGRPHRSASSAVSLIPVHPCGGVVQLCGGQSPVSSAKTKGSVTAAKKVAAQLHVI